MLTIVVTLLFLYILLFLLSIKIQDNSIVDIFWGIGFMIVAILSYQQWIQGSPQKLITLLVCLWGIRISTHIGIRKFRNNHEDPRYTKWRSEWKGVWYFYIRSFFQIYLLQMFLLSIIAIPIFIVNLSSESKEWGILSIMGIWISMIGIVFEMIADIQLTKFIKTKKSGQIFMEWLYKYSRHPNYFGESTFWLGIGIMSIPYSYFGIIGWIMITYLLLCVSGVPLQEAKYRGQSEWEAYKKRTNVFIPWFPKK